MTEVERPITAGICTRDRHASLVRCLRSLAHVEPLLDRALVVDDASDPPVDPVVRREVEGPVAERVTVLREEVARGPSAGRNRIADEARTPYLLYLDDDAVVLTAEAIRAGLRVLEADPSVAVIAFAQADAEGRRLPAQASPARTPAVIQAYIGFAHLLRAEALRAVGGYRARLGINGEERELSLRLLDAGWRVVYLPDAAVAHVADPAGRDMRRFLHLAVRNDCLSALLNEPLPVALAGLPVRLSRYFRMRRGWGVDDPGGFGRIVREVAAQVPAVMRERQPVRWSTLREWRRLAASPAYEPPRAP